MMHASSCWARRSPFVLALLVSAAGACVDTSSSDPLDTDVEDTGDTESAPLVDLHISTLEDAIRAKRDTGLAFASPAASSTRIAPSERASPPS
ncbi:MAG: hypothetical protein R3B70_32445 [Polyangiaceae bacterium]